MSDLPPAPNRFDAPIPAETFEDLRRAFETGTADATAHRWMEKARRFAELNRGKLISKSRSRGMPANEASLLASQITELLVAAGSWSIDGDTPPDLPCLNAALILLDGKAVNEELARLLVRRTDETLEQLPQALADRSGPWHRAARPVAEQLASVCVEHDPPRWSGRATPPTSEAGGRVVIFSPNPFSLYTLSVMAMLHRAGIEIAGLVVRSLLSPGRVTEELNFGRHRLVAKVLRKLVLKTDENPNASGYGMRLLCDELGVTHRNARTWASELGVPVAVVRDLNDDKTHRFLDDRQPDAALFTGGGLVRSPTLERCGRGMLACHPGILPQYRGVDVGHWPLAEGHPDQLGATAYIMDEGVDTGQVAGQMFIDPARFRDHGSLRNELVALKSIFLITVLTRLLDGKVEPQTQPSGGRLYFSMHPEIEKLLDEATLLASR